MIILKIIGILVCISNSAMFSGLNLGLFGLSRLRLEIQAEANNADAARILSLRKDAHYLLATILWGNVSVNVLLTLLIGSIFPILWAFIFSTFGITFFGEIIPQAYFARHALKSSKFLVPAIRLYQVLLFPIAKPTGLFLDALLGKEKTSFFQEEEVKVFLNRHAQSGLTDISLLESLGASNFLAIDDIKTEEEGEIINPQSIIKLPTTPKGLLKFPRYEQVFDDPLLKKINASKEKWVIIINEEGCPVFVLNADQFLRDAMYAKEVKSIYTYCHRPIVVTQPGTKLGEVILEFKVRPEHEEDDVVDNDIILYWNHERRIITGADILGRLLRGIVQRRNVVEQRQETLKRGMNET
ncbi:MAG: DUF21 domain-containing protein [Candidatus Aceula meridiana]|nr:DUF21 domain-containing protein [Candidatus Aceula meridiana]